MTLPLEIVASPFLAPTTAAARVVGGHYRVGRKIREQEFESVFEGVNLRDNEPIIIKFGTNAAGLKIELRAYKSLLGTVGIPLVYHFSREDRHNILVIDRLGPSLQDLLSLCAGRFTIKTICLIAKQMISRLQSVHEKGLIHADIKPEIFRIGLSRSTADIIHLTEFGRSKQYQDISTGVHEPNRERSPFVGAASFLSINAHLGREQSRRDDLESLGYLLLHFFYGELPWQRIDAAFSQKTYKKIGREKQKIPVSVLCKGLPDEFSVYIEYVRKLEFQEKPDYNFLCALFTTVLASTNSQEDYIFDWTVVGNGRRSEASNAGPISAHAKTYAAQITEPRSSGERNESMTSVGLHRLTPFIPPEHRFETEAASSLQENTHRTDLNRFHHLTPLSHGGTNSNPTQHLPVCAIPSVPSGDLQRVHQQQDDTIPQDFVPQVRHLDRLWHRLRRSAEWFKKSTSRV
ncbi:kinase-like domain-containing protein [Hygrophoropsis aurantiaca]|uniref:Kinase-like domain-containing protein n=1 Tax=Hygrophoropsis aurantiaca TaxID=72124 RepID=A0ACB8AI22_9AGAM|nr:kinase-like domain-containing protein [Hygrophoropsis aurantiaca]